MEGTEKGQSDFPLDRFIKAQEGVYERALTEIKSGRKRSHWMWFIFPQIKGLGHSATSRYYAISSLAEARQYLAHPVLGKRLLECVQALLNLKGVTAGEIFGDLDDLKLRSCLTLFALAAGPGSVFEQALRKYYRGERDPLTLEILKRTGQLSGTE